jgi:hypothetical protein
VPDARAIAKRNPRGAATSLPGPEPTWAANIWRPAGRRRQDPREPKAFDAFGASLEAWHIDC